MNREQAERILDAYIELEYPGGNNNARQALRDIILDSMTHCEQPATTTPNTTWPGIKTYPSIVPTTCPKVTYGEYPTNWDGTPKVTCSGVDHAYKQATGVDA